MQRLPLTRGGTGDEDTVGLRSQCEGRGTLRRRGGGFHSRM
jgi:hypothetical protein